MDILHEIHWFAIHAKACRESFAANNVSALGVEVFFPQILEERFFRRCHRIVTRPLFAGYLFARFSASEMVESVRHARGVLAVLSTCRSPIPIEDAIISSLRSRLMPDGYARLQSPVLRRGERVRIDDGPFAGWIGRIQLEYDDGKRVALLLEAIGQARILVEKERLSPVEAALAA